MFWRSLGPNSEAPVYGADTLGTLFAEEDEDSWNVGKLVSFFSAFCFAFFFSFLTVIFVHCRCFLIYHCRWHFCISCSDFGLPHEV